MTAGQRFFEELFHDVRHACRSLSRSPIFPVVAIATLALGVGVTTAVFTIADALLLRPAGVEDPARLVSLASRDAQGRTSGLLLPMLDAITQEGVFDSVCGFIPSSVVTEIDGRVAPVEMQALTGGCFTALGVRGHIGRVLGDVDVRPGAAHVAVLAYDAWTSQFGRRPDVLGKTINVDGARYTIVGVAERGFSGLRLGFPARVFIPLANFEAGLAAYYPPRERLPVTVVGRMPLQASAEQTRARIESLWPSWLSASVPPRMPPAVRARYLERRPAVAEAARGADVSIGERFRRPLVALFALSALMLIVACLNVTTLLVARSASRSKEAAVRLALGASTRRLVQSAIVEAVVVLVVAAAVGLIAAPWAGSILVAMFAHATPGFAIDIGTDARVVAFVAGLSTVAVAASSVMSAWQAGRADVSLADSSSRIAGGQNRLRRAALMTQVACTAVLVSVGSVFVHTLDELRTSPLGMTVEDVLAAQLTAMPGGYEPGVTDSAYYDALLDRVAVVPGVGASALSYEAPLKDTAGTVAVAALGTEMEVTAEQAYVSDSFFATLGIQLASGTTFTPQGRSPAVRSVIVSETIAKALFGDAEAIGRLIRVGGHPLNQRLQVIGIARDAVVSSPRLRNHHVVYMSFWEAPAVFQAYPTLLVRTEDGRSVGFAALQEAVKSGGHEYVSRVRKLVEQRDASLVQERLLASVSWTFGVLGLLLAAMGLYGVLSLAVHARARELAVRHATAAGLQWLVVRDAVAMIGIGLLFGVPAAVSGAALAARSLNGHPPGIVVPTSAALVLIVAAGLAAAWLPARRATRVDPIAALRAE